MTMTVFIVLRNMTNKDRAEEQQLDLEEIRIQDTEADERIPVAEADDEDGDEEWPDDDEPEHYDWEEVYELNGCDSGYF